MVPECNIGTLGHVSHGKTSLVAALTGKITLTHSEELKRGITIRLGYADATIYRCIKCNRYSTTNKCPYCFSDSEIIRTISFVDAPGHETLMATVLTGASLMDGVLFVIAANEKCPQLQTKEHLAVLEIAEIKNAIIIQNKIDTVSEERALKSYEEIKDFVRGSILEEAPIIPVSAQYKTNIDVVLEAMEKFIPTPNRGESNEPKMLVARSFDINKPGAKPEKLVGGILGGAILSSKFSVGEKVEIRPGVKIGNKYQPLFAKIVGLKKAGINLDVAGAGGLLGLMTTLDPSLTKSDSLVGNVVGLPNKMPESKETISLKITFLNRADASNVKVNEIILINVGTARSVGTVSSVKKETIEMKLKIPVCVEEKEKVAISRQIDGRWRLVGYAITA
ncbi:MAG: translation initiation factor IF-2 subunit gamma [Candidatus Aenigmarchaeota archaeon]|nr:translation initiation factor IF-2 subunit gamma [Candidatus Aenigmarchaeota archaeon]